MQVPCDPSPPPLTAACPFGTGPIPGGGFVPFVHEMLGSNVTVTLERRSDGRVLFHGIGEHAGLEIESVETEETRKRGKLSVIRTLLSSDG